MIPLFITAMLAGRQPVSMATGDNRATLRSWPTWFTPICWRPMLRTWPVGRINAADGRSIDLLRLLELLNKLLGTNVKPRFIRRRVGDVRESQADITLARNLLGYEPQVDFEEGLRRSIDYYRQIAGK